MSVKIKKPKPIKFKYNYNQKKKKHSIVIVANYNSHIKACERLGKEPKFKTYEEFAVMWRERAKKYSKKYRALNPEKAYESYRTSIAKKPEYYNKMIPIYKQRVKMRKQQLGI